MTIIWGKRLKWRLVGLVVDFCPVCRALAPFEAHEIALVPHLYLIPLAAGRVLSFEIRCTTCHFSVGLNQLKHPVLHQSPASDPQELFDASSPDARAALQQRLALEEKVKRARLSLTKDERYTLIQEPFVAAEGALRLKLFSEGKMDVHTAIGLGVTLAIAGPMIFLADFFPTYEIALQASGGAVFLAGLGLTAVHAYSAAFRFVTWNLLPKLGTALLPVYPTDHELATVLDALKKAGYSVALRVRPRDVQRHVKKAQYLRRGLTRR